MDGCTYAHTLVLKWLLFHYAAVCFTLRALRAHFQLLNLTTLFSCSICCCLSVSLLLFLLTFFSSQHLLFAISPLSPFLLFLSPLPSSLSALSSHSLPACLEFSLISLLPCTSSYLTLYGLWCHIHWQSHNYSDKHLHRHFTRTISRVEHPKVVTEILKRQNHLECLQWPMSAVLCVYNTITKTREEERSCW